MQRRKVKKKDLVEVEELPPGLHCVDLEDRYGDLFAKARKEVESVADNELRQQIASNQHFFLNLPFPLPSVNLREANTTTFAWGNERIENLEKLFSIALRELGCCKNEEEILDLKKRANVICRQYLPAKGHQISFHVDDLECASLVVGFILLNEADGANGLCFRRGGTGENSTKTLNFTMREKCGTAFSMQDDARYSWQHGLPVVRGRRISVTCRFFKKKVLDRWESKGATAISPSPATTQLLESSSNAKVRITLCVNTNRGMMKPAIVKGSGRDISMKELKKMFKDKLRIDPTIVYLPSGKEWKEGMPIKEGTVLYASRGEAFSGKVEKEADEEEKEKEEGSEKGTKEEEEINKQIDIWNDWRYPRLRFYVEKGISEQPPGLLLGKDTVALGNHIAESHLSIPETRELVLALRALVEQPDSPYQWCFKTELWDTGRSTTVILYSQSGEWVAFTSEGAPALKGDKKRDGPLWALEGGLNNPNDEKPQMHVEDDWVKNNNTNANSRRPRRQGGWDDEIAASGGRKKKGRKQRNTYQSKRGVETTPSMVGFAGSTWCSSYYLCPVELDGARYTSSAHCVMVTQARLFCDEERAAELMALGKDSAPHKAFDHTAPKTGKRKVKGFDPQVWNRCRVRLMFRATFAKFWQNKPLRERMLQLYPRQYVECTDDPQWGCGILLSSNAWQSPKNWLHENVMGKVLTTVAALVRYESNTPEVKRSFLQEEAAQIADVDEWREAVVKFVDASLSLDDQPDAFAPPHWPGAAAMAQVKERVVSLTPQSVLDAAPDEDPTFVQACVYCLEAYLGLRMA